MFFNALLGCPLIVQTSQGIVLGNLQQLFRLPLLIVDID
jgi:hypothetical protein